MKFLLLLFAIFSLTILLSGFRNQDSSLRKDKPDKILGYPNRTLININNISMWTESDGISANSPNGDPGVTFPRGTATTIFTDGIVWGGKVNDGQTPDLRVGGTTYQTGLQPGAILGIRTGNVESPENDNVKIWRIRPDWKELESDLEQLRQDAAELNLMNESDVTQQMLMDVWQGYKNDWENWPVAKGAPYTDINGNGEYDHLTDIAGIAGADQTVWFVANDIYNANFYGSQPIGIEMQVILWAYQRTDNDLFADIVFKHVRLIYKGTANTTTDAVIEDMYISQWSDPDIGVYTDDYFGCDSTTGIIFAYNSQSEDGDFLAFNLKPAAMGYALLQGPIVTSPGDTACFNFSLKPGYTNLPVNSTYYFASGSPDSDPDLGNYDGTLQFYNLLLGLRPRPMYPGGLPWIDPLTQNPTKFPLSGDPLRSTGWIDGFSSGPGDRRMGLNTGPFAMALGDTQEVVTALIGDLSENDGFARLRHIDGVKRKARAIKHFLSTGMAVDIVGQNLVKISETVSLMAACIFLDPDETTQSIVWQLKSKPVGSMATLNSEQGENSGFLPDSIGKYDITVTVTSSLGKTGQAAMVVEATDNRPPEIIMVLDKRKIVWGDSVFVDLSNSTDPDGDSFNFSFESDAFIQPAAGGKGAYIRPLTTGLVRFTVSAFDGYFGSAREDSFFVQPLKSPGISIEYSYLDSAWIPSYSYHFFGDTLLTICPNSADGGIRIYQVGQDTIIFKQKIEMTDVVRIYGIKNNMLYIGKRGSVSGFTGPGPLSIYTIGENWSLSPVLEGYLPGNYEIWSMQFHDHEAFVTAEDRYSSTYYIYKIDFMTNPAAPEIVASKTFSYPSYLNYIMIFDENYIIARVSEYGEKINRILTRTNLSEAGSFTIPGNWRNFTLEDKYMYVTYRDSVVIFDVSSILDQERLSRIQVDVPVSWIDSYPYHTSAGQIDENLMYVYTTYGFAIYNISNPSIPVQTNYMYGINGSIIRHNGAVYLVNTSVNLDNPYSGINKIDLVVGIDGHSPVTPFSHYLYQNFPNPFNPVTSINFSIPKQEKVELIVYDVLGRKVIGLLDRVMTAGTHQINFNGNNLASGLYFYTIHAGNFRDIKKMILLK